MSFLLTLSALLGIDGPGLEHVTLILRSIGHGWVSNPSIGSNIAFGSSIASVP
jgi:hypothetical protein